MKNRPPESPTFKQIIINPMIFFISVTLKKNGWRDGIPGLILIALFSFQIFIQNAKFYEEHHKKS
jgi:hypothetical protein